jgi:exodeoxyribonuclease VII small subunit
MADEEPLAYADAMDELETILAELDRDDVDIDRLAERVARAAALIEFCRSRIESARLDVTRLIENLESPASPLRTRHPPCELGVITHAPTGVSTPSWKGDRQTPFETV